MSAAPNPARLFVAGTLSFALIGAVQPLFGLALPVYGRAFGLSAPEAGQLLSAFGVGAFVAVMLGVLGLWQFTARTALAFLAVGAGVLALQASWLANLAGGVALGAGFGLTSAIINRRFLAEFGPRGPGMVGLVNAVFGLGAIIAPWGVLLAAGQPGPAWAVLAVLAAATIPVVQPNPQAARATGGLRALMRPRAAMLALTFLSVLMEIGLFGYGPSALIARGHLAAQVAGVTSAFFVAFLLSRVAMYWLTRWVAPAWLFFAGIVGTAGCAGLAALGWDVTAYIAAGGMVSVTFPAFFIWATERLGPGPQTASAIQAAALSCAALGPLALSAVLVPLGVTSLFAVLAVLGAATALLLVAVFAATGEGPRPRVTA
ncbi:MAG: hypothetical protein GC146_16675 [Limimaricola sp.]|uniref:MFS transporter n=1 Tax=Limimaricola sp. TaxID=2211665 RepID=UPI001E15E19C|nr:hypothetical protein [Limimaricola sp.]MBI1418853.1 hypothetical protein [Limimaricola sp.]